MDKTDGVCTSCKQERKIVGYTSLLGTKSLYCAACWKDLNMSESLKKRGVFHIEDLND